MGKKKADEILLYDRWLSVVHAHKAEKGELPIVVGRQLYEFFGERVSIREARPLPCGEYRVVIESTFGEMKEVGFDELTLMPERHNSTVKPKAKKPKARKPAKSSPELSRALDFVMGVHRPAKPSQRKGKR